MKYYTVKLLIGTISNLIINNQYSQKQEYRAISVTQKQEYKAISITQKQSKKLSFYTMNRSTFAIFKTNNQPIEN